MSNLNDPLEESGDAIRAVRVAERAGSEHLGASVHELEPGDEMVFHYHVQREELMIVLEDDSPSGAQEVGKNFPKARSSRSPAASAARTDTATSKTSRSAF